MAILRPVKTFGTRKYAEEVAAAPGNEAPIRSAEVDADLDTVYAQVNAGPIGNATGDLTGVYPNPTVLKASGSFDVGGQVLSMSWASGLTAFKLIRNADTGHLAQNNPFAPDDLSKPSWLVSMNSTVAGDNFVVSRRAPGAAANTQRQLLQMDGPGNLYLNSSPPDDTGGLISTEARGISTPQLRMIRRKETASPTIKLNDLVSFIDTWGWDGSTTYATADIRIVAANNWSGTLAGSEMHFYTTPVNTHAKALAAKLYGGGSLSVTGQLLCGGSLVVDDTSKNYWTWNDAGYCMWLVNNAWAPFNTAWSSWYMQVHAQADQVNLNRRAPGGAVPSGAAVFTMTGAGNLTISGPTGTKSTGTAWANPSDIRLKRDVIDYTTGLDAICQLRPVSFCFNGKGGTVDDGRRCTGLIAQEVEPVFPELLTTNRAKLDPADEEDTDLYSLDASNITWALVNAVKELAARVSALEAA